MRRKEESLRVKKKKLFPCWVGYKETNINLVNMVKI